MFPCATLCTASFVVNTSLQVFPSRIVMLFNKIETFPNTNNRSSFQSECLQCILQKKKCLLRKPLKMLATLKFLSRSVNYIGVCPLLIFILVCNDSSRSRSLISLMTESFICKIKCLKLFLQIFEDPERVNSAQEIILFKLYNSDAPWKTQYTGYNLNCTWLKRHNNNKI